ncbi:MAG: EamA family transporter [Gammaproteobacteria bacterium]|nr:EamA family transporter [Gammaproteobacteria bacterium]
MKILGPLAVAFLAALGNSLFALGQKKSVSMENPFVLIVIAAFVCMVLAIFTMPIFGKSNIYDAVRTDGGWALVAGLGLFLTLFGFNVLYTRYGASYYVLYAVLAIVTTSIVLGVMIFKEVFNLYHWLSFISAITTVVLFSIGQSKA